MRLRFTYRQIQKARPGSKPRAWYGECHKPTGEITIDPRQSPSEMLDTEIHEMLHAIYPRMSERRVARGANAISTSLFKLGYRKKKR